MIAVTEKNRGHQFNVGFVSFGGGSLAWYLAGKRIKRQAKASGIFATIKVFNDRTIKHVLSNAEIELVKDNKRGYGFWVWKPRIVEHVLTQNPNLDLILYADAGCEININSKSRARLLNYLEMALANEVVAFDLGLPESHWTKSVTLNYFSSKGAMYPESNQISASCFILTSNFAARLIPQWKDHMLFNNYQNLKDDIDVDENPTFQAHRHDQSIFSLTLKTMKKDLFLPASEIYFFPNWNDGVDFPILNTRNASFFSILNRTRLVKPLRLIERFAFAASRRVFKVSVKSPRRKLDD